MDLQGKDKVKVGIVGLGDWGEAHLQAFQSVPFAEVVSICDINEERAQSLAEKYGVPRAFQHAEQHNAQPDLDLVSVVTYEKDHLEPVLSALKNGKHVIVEKPVSVLANEAHQMEAEAKRQGKMIFPGHVLRFDARYASLHQAIRSGEIGVPISLYLKRSRKKSMFAVYQRTHTVFMSTVHDIDIALWYTGSRVRKVSARGIWTTTAEVPDLLWASLEFENGALAVLESDWLTPDSFHAGVNDAAEVIGDRGILQLNTLANGLYGWSDQKGSLAPDAFIHYALADRYRGALHEQMSYICQCLISGQEPLYVSFADAVHGIEIAEAIERSIASGKEIKLN